LRSIYFDVDLNLLIVGIIFLFFNVFYLFFNWKDSLSFIAFLKASNNSFGLLMNEISKTLRSWISSLESVWASSKETNLKNLFYWLQYTFLWVELKIIVFSHHLKLTLFSNCYGTFLKLKEENLQIVFNVFLSS